MPLLFVFMKKAGHAFDPVYILRVIHCIINIYAISGRIANMKIKSFSGISGVLFVLMMLMTVPSASAVSWTDWTWVATGSSGSGSGSMTIGSATVDVTLSGLAGGLINGDYYYKNYAATYGYLYPSDLIQESGSGPVTVTFSEAVVNPYIALVSVGQPSFYVNYIFANLDGAITVLSSGSNYWGYGSYEIDGSTFSGREFNGIIQLAGTYTSLTFMITPSENWHGFNIGADSVASSVPEPASMMLLGLGLAGIAGIRRKLRG